MASNTSISNFGNQVTETLSHPRYMNDVAPSAASNGIAGDGGPHVSDPHVLAPGDICEGSSEITTAIVRVITASPR